MGGRGGRSRRTGSHARRNLGRFGDRSLRRSRRKLRAGLFRDNGGQPGRRPSFPLSGKPGGTTGRAAGASGRTETGAGRMGTPLLRKPPASAAPLTERPPPARDGSRLLFQQRRRPRARAEDHRRLPGREGAAIENSRSDDSARWAAASPLGLNAERPLPQIVKMRAEQEKHRRGRKRSQQEQRPEQRSRAARHRALHAERDRSAKGTAARIRAFFRHIPPAGAIS